MFFVPNNPTSSDDTYKWSVFLYLATEAIICFVFSLPTIFLFKSKPKHAPSISQNNLKVPEFKESVRILFKNKSFICLMIVCTIIIGYFNLFGCVLSEFLGIYDIDKNTISLVGGISNILGLFSCLVVSVIIDKYKKYKMFFLILSLVGVIVQVLITVLVEVVDESADVYVWGAGLTLMMMTCVPFYAICMDYVCEITYPVGENISGGFILSGSQVLGIAETYFALYCFKINKPFIVNLMLSVSLVFALFALFFLKEELKRNAIEKDEPIENPEFEDTKQALGAEEQKFEDDSQEINDVQTS